MGHSRMAVSAIIGASALLAIAALAAAITAWLGGGLKDQPQGPSQVVPPVDPALQLYRQAAELAVALDEPRALAVLGAGQIVVAGDKRLLVYSPDGTLLKQVALEQPPQCVAAGGPAHLHPERIYVGFRNHVEVFDAQDKRLAVWDSPRQKADFISIAAAQRDVFVADVANRLVWRYAPDGRLLGSLGTADQGRGYPGFVITSRYFDVAASSDGLLYAVNPRLLRIEGFDYNGQPQGTPVRQWGRGSQQLDGFFGCCNPIHLAAFADGRFVTAEKGINWVKIFARSGELECIVASAQELSVPAADLAVDEDDRVLVLDAARKCVRIYAPKTAVLDKAGG